MGLYNRIDRGEVFAWKAQQIRENLERYWGVKSSVPSTRPRSIGELDELRSSIYNDCEKKFREELGQS